MSYASGVPSRYVARVHGFPTRFHGGIWTRPVFGFPYAVSPQSVFKPDDFAPEYYRRYPFGDAGSTAVSAIPALVAVVGILGMFALGAWHLGREMEKAGR